DDEAARRLADDIEHGLVDLPPLSGKIPEAPPEEKKPEPPPPPEPIQRPGQVVDIAKPREEKAPDKAKYAAEYDSNVEKQTKSRYGKPGAAPGKKAPEQQEQVKVVAPPPQPPGPLAMRTPGEEKRSPGTHAGKGLMPEAGEHAPNAPKEKSPDGVLPEN